MLTDEGLDRISLEGCEGILENFEDFRSSPNFFNSLEIKKKTLKKNFFFQFLKNCLFPSPTCSIHTDGLRGHCLCIIKLILVRFQIHHSSMRNRRSWHFNQRFSRRQGRNFRSRSDSRHGYSNLWLFGAFRAKGKRR